MNHLTLVVVSLYMTTNLIIAAVAAFAAALIALAVYHAVAVRPALAKLRALLTTHDDLLGGGSGASDRLAALENAAGELRGSVERVANRTGELEALARTDISRMGFVRYDAYDDTASNLSYALALLNRAGDGVVLTSIYSRTDTRTYAKAVAGFKPAANASEEEVAAIEAARRS